MRGLLGGGAWRGRARPPTSRAACPSGLGAPRGIANAGHRVAESSLVGRGRGGHEARRRRSARLGCQTWLKRRCYRYSRSRENAELARAGWAAAARAATGTRFPGAAAAVMARLADYFIVVGYDHEKPGKGVGRRRPRASPPPPAAVQWARRGRASRPGGGEAGGPGPAVQERWVDWGRAFASRASLAGGGRVSGDRGKAVAGLGRGGAAGGWGAGSVESLPARRHALLWGLRAPGTAPSCRRHWEGGSTLC